jgi:hypothetical protein
MRIEGKGQLPSGAGFGLLLRAEAPLSPREIELLAGQTGARVFSLAQQFRFETITWNAVFARFKEVLTDQVREESTVFVYDLPRESPLNLLAGLFIRYWLKSMVKKGCLLVPGLYLLQDQEPLLRLAKPLDTETIRRLKGRDRLRRYLLTKLRMMDSALELHPFYHPDTNTEGLEPIPEPFDPDLIHAEMEALDPDQRLCRQAEFEVWLARAEQIPVTIQEIGRQRELTFRNVKEGTGKALDIDEYDLYYDQLIIWDKNQKRLVGGYRIGRGDQIFQTYGAQGFYIHSLFRIDEGFYPILPQALELGRSYIIGDYQRKRLPLFLLWKGILHFLLTHPQYRYLYGPVSISSHYTDISRSLIIYFVKKHFFDKQLAQFLRPRKKFRYPVNKKTLELLITGLRGDLDKLNSLIEDIEPSHFRIPVLLRQYIRQNARFIAFNLDPNFSDALDGFIILDLKNIPAETLEALQKEAAPDVD